MASIWKHPKSRYWTACYTDREGRQRKQSTKTVDRRQALRIANDLEDAHRLNLTSHQVRHLYSETAKSLGGEGFQSAGVKDFLEGWIQRRQGELAKASVSAYRHASTRFVSHLGDRGNVSLDRITDRDVLTFRDSIGACLAPVTANNMLKRLRVMLRAALAEGLMQHDPTARVKTLRMEKGGEDSRRAFTVTELQSVLVVAGDSYWRTLILLGIYTGQRLGDLAALRWQQVDLQAGEIQFTTRKTGRRVLVPIVRPLRDLLLAHAASDDPSSHLLPEAAGVTVSHLSREFGEMLGRAGLREERTNLQKKDGAGRRRAINPLTFHSLRHTATSLMKNAGVSAAIVQDIIGHESAEVSRSYTHIESDAKRAALEKLPDLVGLPVVKEREGG